jgi:ATP-dependent DNA ligase
VSRTTAWKAVCKLGLEGIVSKKLDAPYKSGPSKAWLKIKNPKAPAATRAIDGTFWLTPGYFTRDKLVVCGVVGINDLWSAI